VGGDRMTAATALDVFIPGETVDLCAPSAAPEVLDRWYRWFNRRQVTEYLAQGLFPNTLEDQRAFLEAARGARDRLLVLLRPTQSAEIVGVASLSSINFVQRQCDMAIVIGEQVPSADALFFALETKARLTEHAFEVLGMERINSTQVAELVRWQRWQILFGFQVEGVLRKKFRKGQRAADVFVSSCLLEDYLRVRAARPKFWPGKAAMFDLMKALPERSLLDETAEWLRRRQAEYWETITFSTTPAP
jgi:RimJ/RimL family protein N-acetyltransferase